MSDPGDGGASRGLADHHERMDRHARRYPALTSRDLETIKAALWPVWFDLQSRGEHPAADWIGARISNAPEVLGAPAGTISHSAGAAAGSAYCLPAQGSLQHFGEFL